MLFNPINKLIVRTMRNRFADIKHFMEDGAGVQKKVLQYLVETAKNTEFGEKHHFEDISNYTSFRKNVPLRKYEDIQNDVQRIKQGEQNILWPSKIKWFAKSSGTTGAKSKFIPVSQEAIEDCHFKCGKDMLSLLCEAKEDTKIFSGRTLRLGGSTNINQEGEGTFHGDLSAVLIENLPLWVEFRSTPSQDISLLSEWEEKIEKIADQAIKQNVTGLIGVPSWMLVLSKKVLEKTGKQNLLEVWPNLEFYAHGGVSFTPYREKFKALIPSDNMTFLETYNASEGFFGVQDQLENEGMLLMLNYGIFFEFIPLSEYVGVESKAIPLWEVEKGINYAMVISTNSGLWRYIIGDTVKFTSLAPYRIQVTGRTKMFINAFGEEVIIENAEKAVQKASNETGAEVIEFTAAPVYMEEGNTGAHEWIIEFSKDPECMDRFKEILDTTLQSVNSDYEAKRHKNIALRPPIIHRAKANLFYEWLKNKGKLGGQHKIPRLSNNRNYIDELLELNH